LASERVTILATGIVLGDIITQRIQADEGCLLHGRITVCQTREKWNSAVNEYRDIEHLRSVTAGFALPNSPASGVSATEPVPENDIQAVETIPPAVEPETIDPAPAAENETPAFEYAALPREMPFIGEQAAPESPAEEFPPADTAPENAPVTADGAVFTENTPDPPEEAAFTGNTPLLSQNNAAVPAIPFPGTVDTGGNHGES
jgi:hypothetical protein